MKKFVKIFAAIAAVVVAATNVMQSVHAVWPPEDCCLLAPRLTEDVLYPKFMRALETGEPAATYCFFDPDAEHNYFTGHDVLVAPKITRETDAKKISVAIRLKNDAAKRVFGEYFKNEFEEINATATPPTIFPMHEYENVFIISFDDLSKLAPSIALYTRNGIPGSPAFRDRQWCWDRVLLKSCVQAGWAGEPRYIPPAICRAKARVLMRGLKMAQFGQRIRTCESDDKITEMDWGRSWAPYDVVFDKWPCP